MARTRKKDEVLRLILFSDITEVNAMVSLCPYYICVTGLLCRGGFMAQCLGGGRGLQFVERLNNMSEALPRSVLLTYLSSEQKVNMDSQKIANVCHYFHTCYA